MSRRGMLMRSAGLLLLLGFQACYASQKAAVPPKDIADFQDWMGRKYGDRYYCTWGGKPVRVKGPTSDASVPKKHARSGPFDIDNLPSLNEENTNHLIRLFTPLMNEIKDHPSNAAPEPEVSPRTPRFPKTATPARQPGTTPSNASAPEKDLNGALKDHPLVTLASSNTSSNNGALGQRLFRSMEGQGPESPRASGSQEPPSQQPEATPSNPLNEVVVVPDKGANEKEQRLFRNTHPTSEPADPPSHQTQKAIPFDRKSDSEEDSPGGTDLDGLPLRRMPTTTNLFPQSQNNDFSNSDTGKKKGAGCCPWGKN